MLRYRLTVMATLKTARARGVKEPPVRGRRGKEMATAI